MLAINNLIKLKKVCEIYAANQYSFLFNYKIQNYLNKKLIFNQTKMNFIKNLLKLLLCSLLM